MGEQKKSKKVQRAGRPKTFDRPSDVTYKSHMDLFNHLIKAGPTMHGTPTDRVKKSH